jgi:hypothetical protein
MTPLMAVLMLDGTPRVCCVGCTQVLVETGLLRIVREPALPVSNAPPGTFSTIVCEIADGYTLADCQRAIRGRHVGPAWGSA